MFTKVKTPQDVAVVLLGSFTIIVGLTVFLAIASVIVKAAEQMDKLLFWSKAMTTNYSQEAAAQLVRFQNEMIQKLRDENLQLRQELNSCYSQIQEKI